jgi:hypothetical protein
MDTITCSLHILSLEQLYSLKGIIEHKIDKIEERRDITRIIEFVNDDGYHCKQPNENCPTVKGLMTMLLPLIVRVSTMDKEDFNDQHFSDIRIDDQKPWFKRFGYDPDTFNITDDTDWNIDKKKWDFRDWDDPAINLATVYITTYYRRQSCPVEGSIFDTVNDDGDILEWTIRDGKLICDGDEIDGISAWNEYEMFILPPIETV